MRYIEYLIIIWGLYIEVSNLLRGPNENVHMTEKVPRFSSVVPLLLSLIGAIAYAVAAVVWVFSPVTMVRVAGITLVCLSGIGWSLDRSLGKRPTWYPRFDAILSLICLGVIIYVRSVA